MISAWIGFLGSVIGGLIGGLFTFFGVKLTIKNENERKEREEVEKAKINRPRLEIMDFSDIKKANELMEDDYSDLDALALPIDGYNVNGPRAEFYYDNKALDLNNLIYIEYVLKNTGYTEIENVIVATNMPKDTAVMPLNERDFHIKEKLLCYDSYARKRYIKPGDIIKVRIYHLESKMNMGTILGGASIALWLEDVNRRFWKQDISTIKADIENSQLSSYKTFINYVHIPSAIECFKNPYMW